MNQHYKSRISRLSIPPNLKLIVNPALFLDKSLNLITAGIISVSCLFFVSCTQSLSVQENGNTLIEIRDFPQADTTIQVKDYLITYKKNGVYLEGFVENYFDDNKGSFKSKKSVSVEIGENQFAIDAQ